jgi:hypothetical protein
MLHVSIPRDKSKGRQLTVFLKFIRAWYFFYDKMAVLTKNCH